ncbi:MAG: amidohydrolase family protein, partial [Streptomycetaceae bacterium]|nr:amidohydrolase family protein [Streptomycetaceae bacterium]
MRRRTRLRGARVVLPSGVLESGEVVVADGLIESAGPIAEPVEPVGPVEPVEPVESVEPVEPAAADAVHDLSGHWLVPGFVDMHVHGGGGASYMSGDPGQALRVAAFHRAHGTTTTMASLVTASHEELLRSVDALAGLVEDGVLTGIHLEGPYLSRARCGAHDPDLLREPDRGEVDALLRAGRGTVRMVTLAPELAGGVDLVRQLVDAGVSAAVGHTDGTHRETQAAI